MATPSKGKLNLLEYQEALLEKIAQSQPGLGADDIRVVSGDHVYTIPSREISEASAVPPLTHIPGAKPWILGIGNLRAKVLPVGSLDLLLGHKVGAGGICLILKHYPLAMVVTLSESEVADREWNPGSALADGTLNDLVELIGEHT